MDTETNMTVLQKLISASYKLFSRQNGSPLMTDSLSELKGLINQVTKSELKLEPVIERPGVDGAPVTYMKIIDDQVMTVAVFVLRKGSRLPLHDHPRMHGLLKVVHGEVNIKTYTPLDRSKYSVPKSLTDKLLDKYSRMIDVYPAKFEGLRICSEFDECSLITPDSRSIHEIVAESGTAAFLDVLSPPYNSKASSESRPCSYYTEIDTDIQDPSLRYLVEIQAPRDYWCDEVTYEGPPLPLPP